MRITVHGHRGCRGLFPENSIPGFLHAITCGSDFLEMDVVFIDGEVVVSHDPFIKPCRVLGKEDSKHLSFLEIGLKELQKHTYGIDPHPKFPYQKKKSVRISTLKETIYEIEKFCSNHNYHNIRYNIEIKSYPEWIGLYQPEPEIVVNSVLEIINQAGVSSKVLLQSFSIHVLKILNNCSDLPVGKILDRSEVFDIQDYKNLKLYHIAPYFKNVTTNLVEEIRAANLCVIPYTVNDFTDMKHLIDLKVDGIVTDYPDRLAMLLND